ncbi:MAG: HSP20 family molecular chaperone IbpA, partial [Candidatus Binatia bacterium]
CDMGKARAIYQNGFLRIEIPSNSKTTRKRKSPISSDE